MASSKTKPAVRRSSSMKYPSASQTSASSTPLNPSASWSSLHTKSKATATSLLCASPKPPAAWSSTSPRLPSTGFSSKLTSGSHGVPPNHKISQSHMNSETTHRIPNGDFVASKRTNGKGASTLPTSSSKPSVTFGGSAGFVVTNKQKSSQESTREIIQRLTNGGIPSVSATTTTSSSSPRRQQRRYSLDLSAASAENSPSSPRAFSSETSEPKSILKNGKSRRCSISYGEIARGIATSSSLPTLLTSKPPFSSSSIHSGECSATPTSAGVKFCRDMDTVLESDLDLSLLPTDDDILRNCQYRLEPTPAVTSLCDDGGMKRVTFDDDVTIMSKGRRNRRHSVPSMK